MPSVTTLQVDLPTEFAGLLGPQGQATEIAREFIILGAYQEGRISGGKAAELLDMTKRGFISLLARKRINYFQLAPEEWEEEVDTVRQWTSRHG